MKKCIKALICIFILASMAVFALGNFNSAKKDNTVEIWWYEYEKEYAYNNIIGRMVNLIVYNSNNYQDIPVKEVKYSYRDMSYDDYVFKRNIALSTKNAFTIDDSKSLYSLKNYNDDYNKIENYSSDTYIDMFKGKYCVPMGIYSECVLMNKDIFDYYSIDVRQDKLYMYSEFLDLRQKLKAEGADFRLSKQEYYYTIDYYIDKNKLNSADLCDPIDMGEEKYRQALKNTILEAYDDFNRYYSDRFSYNAIIENSSEEFIEIKDNEIYDTASQQALMSTYTIRPFNIVDYNKASRDFDDKIPVLLDSYYTEGKLKTPGIFIYKRNHDKNLYKVANELLTHTYYNIILPPNMYGGKNMCYIPTFVNMQTFKTLGVDENFKCNSFMAVLAKLGQKKIAEQVNLMDTVTSNIMNDIKAQNQLMNNFSRDKSVDYLYDFIIEELVKLMENKKNTKELDDSIFAFTRNYYIRIK